MNSIYIRASAGVLLLTSGAGVGMFLYKNWVSRNRLDPAVVFCECQPRLFDRVVVITGATSGIGYQVALACAKQGATVIFGARNKTKGDNRACELRLKSNNSNVVCLPLDLDDLESCKAFAEDVKNREPVITFLVNNAGILNQPPKITKDGFESTWQTNFLGTVVITENLKDNIGIGIDGNKGIIFTSSESIEMVKPSSVMDTDQMKHIPVFGNFEASVEHYARTKYALWMYATYLAYSQGRNIFYKVVSVNPGNVWTNIYRNTFFGSLRGLFTRWQCSLVMRTPIEGAQTVIHCLNAPVVFNGVCMKDCSVSKKPCKDTIEHSPAFVANVHEKLRPYIPNQFSESDGTSLGSASGRNRESLGPLSVDV